MRVRFLRDFDWSPPEHGGRTTMAYKAGQVVTVRRKAGEDAIAAGAAEEAANGQSDDERR